MAKLLKAIIFPSLLAILSLVTPSSGKSVNYVLNNLAENEIDPKVGRIYLIVEMTNNIFDEISYKIVDKSDESLEVDENYDSRPEYNSFEDAQRHDIYYYDSVEAAPQQSVYTDNVKRNSDLSSDYEVYLVIRNTTVHQDKVGNGVSEPKMVVNNSKVKLDLRVPSLLVRNFALKGFHDYADDRFY